ncbi:hypothetical protein QBC34DRAFT_378602 [Podospora aff. communis PSN243]|uniref:NACHT domain-containing protein n=1 Tax=Podospora aff. communis PSN243 TaxID=3040156 RepID=A0AAV9GSM0_9PEZI|nr:hypothetical protein QBC34DRAFT_378602 [Podospora aff. communis PSN243]
MAQNARESSPATSEELFEAALQVTRAALSERDAERFQKFGDHMEMTQALQTHVRRYATTSPRLLECAERIALFSDVFAPFFDVVGVLVQVKAEWAAMFWGTWLFIFKIGSNFVTFLERVSDMFDEMTTILPRYQQWYEVCRLSNSAIHDRGRLAQALAFIYHDLTKFCMHIYFLFSRQDSGRIKRALLGAELAVRPFGARFSRLRERLVKHQDWFEKEVYLQEHALLTTFHEEFRSFVSSNENERSRSTLAYRRFDEEKVTQVKQWVNSVDYASTYEEITKQVHEDYAFNKPRDVPGAGADTWSKQVLFFKAKPGFGKTYLSTVLIRDLAGKATTADDGPSVAYFHFDSKNKRRGNLAEEAFRAVAAQLLHSHRRDRMAIDALDLVRTGTGSGHYTSSQADVRLVTDLLLRQRPAFIVVDGVDECVETERFLEEVRSLCIEHDCRFLLLGRPSVAIPHHWVMYGLTDPSVTLEPPLILADIASFIRYEVAILAARGLFGPDLRSVDDLERFIGGDTESLSSASEGLFLWARLLVNFLRSPELTPRDRLDILRRPGYIRGLDQLYARLLGLLERGSRQSKLVTRRLFHWIAFSIMPLSLEAFKVALAVRVWKSTSEMDYLPDYPGCIAVITCSLVEVRSEFNTLMFIHATFRDFLRSYRPPDGMHSHSTDVILHLTPTMFPSPQSKNREGDYNRPSADSYTMSTTWDEPEPSIFAPDPAVVHGELAEISPSHLLCDIPHQPLFELHPIGSDRLGIEASSNSLLATAEQAATIAFARSKTQLTVDRPFLTYAALCWSRHLTEAAVAGISYHTTPLWFTLLSEFLLDRYAVTTWVEAAYTYGQVPRLQRLAHALRHIDPRSSACQGTTVASPSSGLEHFSTETRERAWVHVGLRQLAAALDHVATIHSEDLLENPSLLWQQGIVRAIDPEFWPIWHPRVTSARQVPPERTTDAGSSWRPGDRIASHS